MNALTPVSMAHLIIALDDAMVRVSQRVLAAGGTEAQADAAALAMLEAHLADVQDRIAQVQS